MGLAEEKDLHDTAVTSSDTNLLSSKQVGKSAKKGTKKSPASAIAIITDTTKSDGEDSTKPKKSKKYRNATVKEPMLTEVREAEEQIEDKKIRKTERLCRRSTKADFDLENLPHTSSNSETNSNVSVAVGAPYPNGEEIAETDKNPERKTESIKRKKTAKKKRIEDQTLETVIFAPGPLDLAADSKTTKQAVGTDTLGIGYANISQPSKRGCRTPKHVRKDETSENAVAHSKPGSKPDSSKQTVVADPFEIACANVSVESSKRNRRTPKKMEIEAVLKALEPSFNPSNNDFSESLSSSGRTRGRRQSVLAKSDTESSCAILNVRVERPNLVTCSPNAAGEMSQLLKKKKKNVPSILDQSKLRSQTEKATVRSLDQINIKKG